jgi:fatty acid-binding protein DegV
LGIKPILQMDEEGHLIKVSTARGRKKAIEALANKYAELSYEEKNTPIFVSHGDCEDEAQELADILRKAHGVEVRLITYVGSVIGAHSGPGTIALFFVGEERK